MDAFEHAWALLKMPIIPESIQHTGTNDGIDEYEAQFEHPVTGEIYPMRGDVHDREANTFIFNPGTEPGHENMRQWTGSTHGPIGDSNFSPRTDEAEDAKTWEGRPYIAERDFAYRDSEGNMPNLDGDEAPPVGMGSALYDLAARMAHERAGAKIVPSPNRSTPAMNMWAKHEDKGHWPVRDDL